MVKVSAPGNVFLLGEHSVVYERPAIVTAINRRTYTEATKRHDNKIIVSSENYGNVETNVEEVLDFSSDYANEMDPLIDMLRLFGERYGVSGVNLKIYSDIPKSSGGMSSSTAVLCSVLGALSKLHEKEIAPQKFFDLVYPIQVKIHGGKASGSEIVSSS